jgi:uncharacterized membrane protein
MLQESGLVFIADSLPGLVAAIMSVCPTLREYRRTSPPRSSRAGEIDMKRAKTVLLWLLSLNLIAAGFMHLMTPAFFVRIIPPELPNPEWLNVISGLAEIVIGVYLLEPRTRVYAAWGAIALFIAVFPANIYAAMENVGPEGPGTGIGAGNFARLPFQAVLLVWAWWYTREE